MTSATDDGSSALACFESSSMVIEDDRTGLERFSAAYQLIHGYFSLVVCVVGIVLNALNVVVLTRRSMQNATNCLLAALAVTDLLTMTAHNPYTAGTGTDLTENCFSHSELERDA